MTWEKFFETWGYILGGVGVLVLIGVVGYSIYDSGRTAGKLEIEAKQDATPLADVHFKTIHCSHHKYGSFMKARFSNGQELWMENRIFESFCNKMERGEGKE